MIARSRTDLQDLVRIAHVKQLGHQRDDQGLGDRLALTDGKYSVLVCDACQFMRHELVTWSLGQRFQYAWTKLGNASFGGQWGSRTLDFFNHQAPLGDEILRRSGAR